MNTSGTTSISQRRRRERFWVIVLVLAAVFVFGFLEERYFQQNADLHPAGNIFIFALVNLNVILLLLLTYLVLRNIVKLIFERKRDILGHKLRTRLVIAFVGLTLIPTIPLFWLATQFIFSSLDTWFSQRVEQSLEQAVVLARDYLEEEKKSLAFDCQQMKPELLNVMGSIYGLEQSDNENPLPTELPPVELSRPVEPRVIPPSYLEQYQLDAILVFGSKGDLLWRAQKLDSLPVDFESLHNLFEEEPGSSPGIQNLTLANKRECLLLQAELNLKDASQREVKGKFVALRLLPSHMSEELAIITSGYEDYLQLKLLHKPLKVSHFITFSVVTLLVIFAAIWFGFFLARTITVPVQALLSATQQIAEGDLNVHVDTERADEIGLLITSFNKMVRDLRESREQLDNAYLALQQSHVELEDRRRYMEIVLGNIAAGVVSVDAYGGIMTLNKSAEEAFGLQASQTRGRHYSELLQPPQMEIVKAFMNSYRLSRQPYLEQQVQVMTGNRPMVLLIKVSVLRDEQDQYMGVVVVLDDLTDLEKAQRMAAWREVARRIAHEIKNPITPIQLCAQRLKRKYSDILGADGSVLDECTRTIVQQVEQMKRLVDEFSKFARLPRAQLTPSDLPFLVDEALTLYRHTYPHVSFILEKEGDFPPIELDRGQIKQVIVNLLENALHALDGEGGGISVRLCYDAILKIARVEFCDTGHGLSPEDKLRMFEPYYSTKEKGSGLGLAIVASIIADHNGFIRVRDNMPRGTVVVIELPG